MRSAVRTVLAMAGAAAGVLILEILFGLWFSSDGWERALALNIPINLRVEYDASNLYDGGDRVVYTRDEYGLRGSYGTPVDIRILTVGGSTTNQRSITDGRTWQDEMARALRERNIHAPVANAGVEGHSTFGHLASFRYWFPLIPGLAPAYTILYVGINDFFVDGPLAGFEGRADGRVTVKSRLKADSAFYRLYALTIRAIAARTAGLGHAAVDPRTVRYTTVPNLRNHDAIAAPRVTRFGARMAALVNAVRRSRSIPVCVTQPTLYYRLTPSGTVEGVEFTIQTLPAGPVNGVDYFRLRTRQDEEMLAVCREGGANTIDLASAVWRSEDFYDLVHMTPEGARQVGRRIADVMAAWRF